VRSPHQISFRLKQELAHLLFWRFPPSLSTIRPASQLSPAAEQFHSTASPAEIASLADEILRHRFPIFDGILETGPEIRWRRVAGRFRRPYPDFPRRRRWQVPGSKLVEEQMQSQAAARKPPPHLPG
jgi:hypothetical protein